MERRRPSLDDLPSEVLLRIFALELDLITTHRERLNDLTALSLVCRALRGPAQEALFGSVFIRASGRAALLSATLEKNSTLRRSVHSIAWSTGTRHSHPSLLTNLIQLCCPGGLALGDGFFMNPMHRDAARELSEQMAQLDKLHSFSYGGWDPHLASSDHISGHLSRWTHLQRLDLRRVAWRSATLATSDVAGTILADFSLQSGSLWRMLESPTFALTHIGVDFYGNDFAATADSASWLMWLLTSSKHSLRSVKLHNLTQSLPEDAGLLIQASACQWTNLSITEYGASSGLVLGNWLCWEATELLSLTLGIANTLSSSGSAIPPGQLATTDILKRKHHLQILEVHHMDLFLELDVEAALQVNHLPVLQHIVLVKASVVHPKVQSLRRFCATRGINVLVRR